MSYPEQAERHALLAVPTRARIVELVRTAGEPVTAQQLSDALSLNVTTVRFHLDLLTRAGLLVAETLPAQGRGRRRIGYCPGLVDLAEVREQMIDALARALDDRSSRDRALAAGRQWAEHLPAPDGDAVEALTEALGRLGFAPHADGDAIALHECPFADAARATPQVVCRVHLGLARGIAMRASGGRTDVDLIPFAAPGICRLTITTNPQHTRTRRTP